jgi:hypothetical protein
VARAGSSDMKAADAGGGGHEQGGGTWHASCPLRSGGSGTKQIMRARMCAPPGPQSPIQNAPPLIALNCADVLIGAGSPRGKPRCMGPHGATWATSWPRGRGGSACA